MINNDVVEVLLNGKDDTDFPETLTMEEFSSIREYIIRCRQELDSIWQKLHASKVIPSAYEYNGSSRAISCPATHDRERL